MILNRYIQLHIVWPFFIITLIMTMMVWMAQAFRILDLVVSRGIEPLDFITIAMLLIPSLVFLLLPISSLIATTYVLYRMYGERELIICKALGMSSWKIAQPILQMMFLVTVISYLNAALLLPYSYQKFKDMQDYFRNNYAALLLQKSSFNSPIPGLTVYVEEQDGNEVRGIFVYDNRSDTKQTTIIAAKGKLIKSQGSVLLELEDGTHQEKNTKTNRLSILKFSRYIFNLQLVGKNDKDRGVDPNEMDLLRLWHSIKNNEYPVGIAKAKANFHQRMTWPLYSFTLSLLVTAMIIAAPKYSRNLPTMLFFTAALLCSGFLVVAIMCTNFGMHTPIFFSMTYCNHLLILLFSTWRFKRY